MSRFLLKFVRSMVMSVLENIQGQIRATQDDVKAPLESMMQEVVRGVWKGDGADAFVNEIQTFFIPETNRVLESCNITTGSIHRSIEAIDAADERIRNLVNGLDDVFRAIY